MVYQVKIKVMSSLDKNWLTAKRVGHKLAVIIHVRWYASSVAHIRYVHDYEHDYVSKYKYKTFMHVQDFK